MNTSELLVDAFGRIRGGVQEVLGGLHPDVLSFSPGPRSNSIAWLVWHLTRVQDDHVASAAGSDQVWISAGFAELFGLPFEPRATGYGQRPEEAAEMKVSSTELLLDYHEAVYRASVAYLGQLGESDLDRIVDRSWSPPVSLGVRLVSVVEDGLQHVGQAAYLRGLAGRG